MEPIKDKLMEEEWNINALKEKKLGKGIMLEIWEDYKFKIRTLAYIRSKILSFK